MEDLEQYRNNHASGEHCDGAKLNSFLNYKSAAYRADLQGWQRTKSPSAASLATHRKTESMFGRVALAVI
jgi:hypothetical protein